MAMTVRDLQIKQSSRMLTNFLRRHTRIHWRKDWDPTEPTAIRPLAFTDHTAATPATYFYTHDLTKNICELLSRNGSAVEVVTEYDYTPFGAVIASNSATPNTFTFSSEVLDAEISLIYYNYRHYNPVDGRWISRDPIEEQGGVNSYCFIRNNAIYKIDFQGLAYSYCNLIKVQVAGSGDVIKRKRITRGLIEFWIEERVVTRRKCFFRCYYDTRENCSSIPCKNKDCQLDHGIEELITTFSRSKSVPAPECKSASVKNTVIARG